MQNVAIIQTVHRTEALCTSNHNYYYYTVNQKWMLDKTEQKKRDRSLIDRCFNLLYFTITLLHSSILPVLHGGYIYNLLIRLKLCLYLTINTIDIIKRSNKVTKLGKIQMKTHFSQTFTLKYNKEMLCSRWLQFQCVTAKSGKHISTLLWMRSAFWRAEM